jgi:hypothetical protein
MAVENHKRNVAEVSRHFSARLDSRLVDILERRAKENDRSVSAELRQVLRDAFREEMAA